MIAIGLLVEAIAALTVIIALLIGDGAVDVLWASVIMVSIGLLVAMLGVARARPPLRVQLGSGVASTGRGDA